MSKATVTINAKVDVLGLMARGIYNALQEHFELVLCSNGPEDATDKEIVSVIREQLERMAHKQVDAKSDEIDVSEIVYLIEMGEQDSFVQTIEGAKLARKQLEELLARVK